MRSYSLAALAMMVAIAAFLAPSAGAKFKVSVSVEPGRPVAKRPAQVMLRTGVVLPQGQRLRLVAVGPWRDESGQTVIDARLMRTGPKAFRSTVRFAYAGRWIITVVPESGAFPPVGRKVKVRARPAS